MKGKEILADSGASNTVCIKNLGENCANLIDKFTHHNFKLPAFSRDFS